MKVLVTGATGFTGSYVVPLLLDRGYRVRCLVRSSSDRKALSGMEVEWVSGDLSSRESLEKSMNGVHTLVNIASIGFGHASNIVQAAVASSIKRAVFLSTTALFTKLDASSKTIRLAAEDTIQNSHLAYTILRPTMIYGSSRDRNICRLIRYLQRYSLIPVFGNGEYLQQPVYVKDVARAVVNSISTGDAVRKAYNLPGRAALPFNEVIDTISRKLDRKVRKIHLPSSPIVRMLQILEGCGIRCPLKAEQILRLNEHKAFDFLDASRDFGYAPLSFAQGISLELQEMGLR